MQSFTSKILCGVMSAVFHSSLINNAKMSDKAGNATKDKKSRYKPSKGFCHEVHTSGECNYEKLTNTSCTTDRVVVFIHGGSFKVKLIDSYRRLAERFSKLLDGATVISVDYRVFPEHTFPKQMEDVIGVYLHLLSQGIKSSDIVFIGDSAGANLALTSALWLRDNNRPLPGAILCISLSGDLTAGNKEREKNAYTDPLYGLPRRAKIEDNLSSIHRVTAYAKELDKTDPYVSPCFGSFEGFPPVTLICAEGELDECDNDVAYRKMKEAKVDVTLHKFEGMFHDFPLLPFLPESKKAYKIIADRIKGE